MSGNKFTVRASDSIGYYVYCLVDPRDNKVFYIGKGKGDRTFAHVRNVDPEADENEKNRRIAEIGPENVRHIIIRHGLTSDEALNLESALIDFMMDSRVNGGNSLTNLIHGHHIKRKNNEHLKKDLGIMSVEEINAQYPEHPFIPNEGDKIIIVLLNRFKLEDGSNEANQLYERARGWWWISEEKIKQCTHVLAVYHGIVRAVYCPKSSDWEKVERTTPKGRKQTRWQFTACEETESPYKYAKIYTEVIESIEDSSNTEKPKNKRRKIGEPGVKVAPRRGAWCANY
ncbi:MAG: endonuclease [Muribaculaceae bacterium]|nr:endonuclease [Muribaculaceae bacterium]